MLFWIWFETVHWFKESRVSFEKVGPREHNGGTILTRRPETTNVRWNLGEKVVTISTLKMEIVLHVEQSVWCWATYVWVGCTEAVPLWVAVVKNVSRRNESENHEHRNDEHEFLILIFTQSLILREIAVKVTIYRWVLVVSSLASEVLSKDDRKYSERTSLCSN